MAALVHLRSWGNEIMPVEERGTHDIRIRTFQLKGMRIVTAKNEHTENR
jgi:hypothetical protein